MELITYTGLTYMFVGMFFVAFLGAIVYRIVTFLPRFIRRMEKRD